MMPFSELVLCCFCGNDACNGCAHISDSRLVSIPRSLTIYLTRSS